jgi:hypothetical protein
MKARSSRRGRSNEREIGAAFSVLIQQQVGAIIVGSVDRGRARYHSITSSARSKTEVGRFSPSARAVLRLMTISNFVGRSA